MYELTIKKDEERAATYDVCDKDQVNDIYCRGEVTFVPPDFFFEEGTKYKINVYWSELRYQGKVFDLDTGVAT